MKKTLMCIMASLLALSGCEKTHETVTPGQGAGGVATMEFTGISETVPGEEENISRSTPFSSGIVNWTIDDEIGVWDGSSYVKATVTAVDGKNVTFTAAVDPGSSEYVFVSPYECGKPSGSFAVDGSGNVTVSTGGTAQSAFGQVVMVGKASKGDTSVSFKNAGNLLRFVLDRDDVAAVTFKGAGGENVAGTVTVDPATGMKTAASLSSATITVPVFKGENFIALPQDLSLSGGFEISLYADEACTDKLGTVTGSNALSLTRNEMKNLGTLDSKTVSDAFTYEFPDPVFAVSSQVFSSLGKSTRFFSLNSPTAWTASVDPSSTATGISLATTSGGAGSLAKFNVTVANPNTDMRNRKTVVIKFALSGGKPDVYVTMYQEKGSIMELEFFDQDKTARVWPFDEDARTETAEKTSSYTIAGYSFGYHALSTQQFHTYGWQIGTGANNYVQTPAVAGWRLFKAAVAEYNGRSIRIADTSDEVVSGGEVFKVTRDVVHSWILGSSTSGVAYRIANTDSGTLRIRYIRLEYTESPFLAEVVCPDGGYSDPLLFSSLGSNPSKANAAHGKRYISVSSPVAWTAAPGPSNTASGVQITPASGSDGTSIIEVTVGANTNFDNRKTVAVEITPEAGTSAEILFEQEKASVMTLEFRDLENKTGVWAFEEDPNNGVGIGTGSPVTYTVAGYGFKCLATDANMYESNYGWRVGRAVGDYIEFPAVPGRRLSKVYIIDANGTAACHIKDTDGNDVAGGVTDYTSAKTGATFRLPKTKINTAYRLQATVGQTIRCKHLELTYE